MTKTENYQLNQWEPADPIRRTDFNADNAAIDAAIKAVADTAASKASVESVSALSESVNSQITALAEALGSGGKTCRIAWGSYTGTGTMQQSLNFDFYPVLVLVGSSAYASNVGCPSTFMRDMAGAHSDTGSKSIQLTWSDTGVSWTGKEDNESSPGLNQNNASGRIYYYCAIGY